MTYFSIYKIPEGACITNYAVNMPVCLVLCFGEA